MIKDVMPRFLLLTGLDGRPWEIIETDEGVRSHRKEGRTEWRPGLPETVPVHLLPNKENLEDRLLNCPPGIHHSWNVGNFEECMGWFTTAIGLWHRGMQPVPCVMAHLILLAV